MRDFRGLARGQLGCAALAASCEESPACALVEDVGADIVGLVAAAAVSTNRPASSSRADHERGDDEQPQDNHLVLLRQGDGPPHLSRAAHLVNAGGLGPGRDLKRTCIAGSVSSIGGLGPIPGPWTGLVA
jgi:hypothetical protein